MFPLERCAAGICWAWLGIPVACSSWMPPYATCQVIEAAKLLSQLQLEPVPQRATEAQAATAATAATASENQYAIIDTNQLLDHLDAVNSILEHIVSWVRCWFVHVFCKLMFSLVCVLSCNF